MMTTTKIKDNTVWKVQCQQCEANLSEEIETAVLAGK